ncbi:MAG: DUF192 domain-containing protein [Bryobacteraceae bacterium]
MKYWWLLLHPLMRLSLFFLLMTLVLAGCRDEKAAVEEFNTRPLKLPDGTTIRVEVMMDQKDVMRGMMFRDSLPEGRGMVFVHARPLKLSYWMYQVKVPLDIAWLNANKQIVEVSENTPPCKTKASECPTYGGKEDSSYALELPGGYGRKHGVQVGNVVSF